MGGPLCRITKSGRTKGGVEVGTRTIRPSVEPPARLEVWRQVPAEKRDSIAEAFLCQPGPTGSLLPPRNHLPQIDTDEVDARPEHQFRSAPTNRPKPAYWFSSLVMRFGESCVITRVVTR